MWSVRPLVNHEHRTTLGQARLVHARGLLSAAVCAELTARVLAAESEWTEDFGGDQFSLGRAWYTHFETGRSRHYFRDAAKANALVERILPGVQDGVRELVSALVGEPAEMRAGWCGPGVHLFLPGSPVAAGGGSIHYDLEGLRSEQERQGPALSLVIMLQPAVEGGGLRLWPSRYQGALSPAEAEVRARYETHGYGIGDAIVFESQRLHQIEPFAGEHARVSITAHALRPAAGPWQVWF